MAAQQNVVAALRGGPVALLAAFASVLACAGCIALINRTERAHEIDFDSHEAGADTEPNLATHRA
jgi:malonate transporter MadL subunit